ncbi:MAG: tetratricopeptide repeat protein [Sedimentisphaerales bacterium]|nr:tetratricopeptide repeat protein [Sedimentisphaerales bacterium]
MSIRDIVRRLFIVGFALLIVGATTLVFHQTQSFFKNSVRGIRYYSNGDYEQTAIYLEAARKQQPDNMQILQYLTWSYDKLGKDKELLATLDIMSKKNPDDLETKKWLADTYYGLNDYANAQHYYEQIFKVEKDPQVLRKLALVTAYQKKYSLAAPMLSELISQDPKDFELIELLADIFSWSGNFEDSERLYRRLLARTDEVKANKQKISLKLADTLRYAGKDKEAVIYYTQVMKGAW